MRRDQSLQERARREASRLSTAPARPRPTWATRCWKPSRPAEEVPASPLILVDDLDAYRWAIPDRAGDAAADRIAGRRCRCACGPATEWTGGRRSGRVGRDGQIGSSGRRGALPSVGLLWDRWLRQHAIGFLSDAERASGSRVFRPRSPVATSPPISPYPGADRRRIPRTTSAANRLGYALQLGALRYPGFSPDDPSTVPEAVVAFVPKPLDVAPTTATVWATRPDAHRASTAPRQVAQSRSVQLRRP